MQHRFQYVRFMDIDKARENRLRRAAARQGLTLTKSRRRDPRALDYGKYSLINLNTMASQTDLTLDAVEELLSN